MKKLLFGLYFLVCLYDCCLAQVNDSITYNAAILIRNDSMPISNGQLLVLPHQGLFIINNNTFYSLDEERCPDVNKFRILENIPFNRVIVNDNDLIVKSQQFLMLLGEEKTEILDEFDTENFTIFSGNDSIINIVARENPDTCSWYKYDRRTGDVMNIMSINEPIKKIVAGNNIDFCIIKNNIYYIKDSICGELVISEEPIIDMVLLPKGLMFCTKNQLSFITNETVTPLAQGDFHSLFNDEGVVYVVLNNGNIWRLY